MGPVALPWTGEKGGERRWKGGWSSYIHIVLKGSGHYCQGILEIREFSRKISFVIFCVDLIFSICFDSNRTRTRTITMVSIKESPPNGTAAPSSTGIKIIVVGAGMRHDLTSYRYCVV